MVGLLSSPAIDAASLLGAGVESGVLGISSVGGLDTGESIEVQVHLHVKVQVNNVTGKCNNLLILLYNLIN